MDSQGSQNNTNQVDNSSPKGKKEPQTPKQQGELDQNQAQPTQGQPKESPADAATNNDVKEIVSEKMVR